MEKIHNRGLLFSFVGESGETVTYIIRRTR